MGWVFHADVEAAGMMATVVMGRKTANRGPRSA